LLFHSITLDHFKPVLKAGLELSASLTQAKPTKTLQPGYIPPNSLQKQYLSILKQYGDLSA